MRKRATLYVGIVLVGVLCIFIAIYIFFMQGPKKAPSLVPIATSPSY